MGREEECKAEGNGEAWGKIKRWDLKGVDGSREAAGRGAWRRGENEE